MLLLGPPGTGATYLATGPLPELRRLSRYPLLVIDEVGYVSFGPKPPTSATMKGRSALLQPTRGG